ncbi:hypothetical protein N781_13105 [Pontibacillus halophilus JSM 076056 = DSM 19796]|uniref:Uncharacterized protein n=1 Tax=Pontibacillus halophilus JSM 076056 = DSM 19796 TaxID=1385510 RepID=A0A0A5IB42_9BACI|nr:hypothetical protein [Pontibacillus halophilus]KGX93037.1 hypothetical protein N781_13105 [Pontibacillus halophilus JSM 076056 = DSM 19796]
MADKRKERPEGKRREELQAVAKGQAVSSNGSNEWRGESDPAKVDKYTDCRQGWC